MDEKSKGTVERLWRFDRSFFVRMTLSFLIFLLVVAVIEAGLRYGFEVYTFYHRDAEETRVAADRLAEDVRSIMLNEGGPVASRTVYPILQRNHELAGLHIAIEPARVTSNSIAQAFGFEPRGVPPNWPDGLHHESRVDLRADQFCLGCHGEAAVGDVLGTVTVRRYLDTRLGVWWEGVRLSLVLNLVKIVVNIAILFFLLRALMEPLQSLRTAVIRLSQGTGGLSVRAPVRSDDEFGQLAQGLNAFLDRLQGILLDLRATITKIVSVSDRLARATGRGSVAVSQVQGTVEQTLPNAAEDAAKLVGDVHELRHVMDEIGFLEEQLIDVTDGGNRLLGRLMDQ